MVKFNNTEVEYALDKYKAENKEQFVLFLPYFYSKLVLS